MKDLDEIYSHLARDWPSEELAARYASTRDHGARAIKNPRPAVARTLPMVAITLPPAATLDVAVYVLHMLRASNHDDLARRLVDNAQQSAGAVLHRCHRALELDGATHSYTAKEWLPVICDRAAELLKSARLNEEPPTMVREAQDAISWLSRALIELRPRRRRDGERPQRDHSASARGMGLRRHLAIS